MGGWKTSLLAADNVATLGSRPRCLKAKEDLNPELINASARAEMTS